MSVFGRNPFTFFFNRSPPIHQPPLFHPAWVILRYRTYNLHPCKERERGKGEGERGKGKGEKITPLTAM